MNLVIPNLLRLVLRTMMKLMIYYDYQIMIGAVELNYNF